MSKGPVHYPHILTLRIGTEDLTVLQRLAGERRESVSAIIRRAIQREILRLEREAKNLKR